MAFSHLTSTPSLTLLSRLSTFIDGIVGVMVERSRAHQAIDSTALIRERLSSFLSESQQDASLSSAERAYLAKILSPEKEALLWLHREIISRLITSLDTQSAPDISIAASNKEPVSGLWEDDGVSFPPGRRVRFTYKGVTVEGILLSGKRIQVLESADSNPIYTSISTAANATADKINAARKNQQGENTPAEDDIKPASLNGWTYWSVLVGDRWIKMADIRLKMAETRSLKHKESHDNGVAGA